MDLFPPVWLFALVLTELWAKEHIKMDMLFAIDRPYQLPELSKLRAGLLATVKDYFEISEEYTRLGLTVFGSETLTLEPTGNFDRFSEAFRDMRGDGNREWMMNSFKHLYYVWKRVRRRDCAKVTVVVLASLPADVEHGHLSGRTLSIAHWLWEYGPMYVTYDGNFLGPVLLYSMPKMDFLREVAGAIEKFMIFGQSFGFVLNATISLLDNDLCTIQFGACRFVDSNRSACRSFTYRTSRYKICRHSWQSSQNDCSSLQDCTEECDKRWPWDDSVDCFCNGSQHRKGDNQFAHLISYCPISRRCDDDCDFDPNRNDASPTTEITTTPTVESTPTTVRRTKQIRYFLPSIRPLPYKPPRFPVWLIVLLLLATLILAAVLSCTIRNIRQQCLKRRYAEPKPLIVVDDADLPRPVRNAKIDRSTTMLLKSSVIGTKLGNEPKGQQGSKSQRNTEPGLTKTVDNRSHSSGSPSHLYSNLGKSHGENCESPSPSKRKPESPKTAQKSTTAKKAKTAKKPESPKTSKKPTSPKTGKKPESPKTTNKNTKKAVSPKATATKIASPKTAKKPESPKASKKPESPKTSKKPESPKASKKPESPKTSKKPGSPKITKTVGSPVTAKKPESPKASKKPESPKASKKPESPKASKKPESPKASKKPESPKTSTKPGSPKITKTVGSPKTAKKPESPKTAKKALSPKTAKKPDSPRTTKKVETAKTTKKPESPKTTKKPESPKPSKTRKSPSPSNKPKTIAKQTTSKLAASKGSNDKKLKPSPKLPSNSAANKKTTLQTKTTTKRR